MAVFRQRGGEWLANHNDETLTFPSKSFVASWVDNLLRETT